jgi:hypothetical protein
MADTLKSWGILNGAGLEEGILSLMTHFTMRLSMLFWKNALPAAALLLLLNACGTSPESARTVAETPEKETTSKTNKPETETPVTRPEATDAQSSYVRVDAADGQSAVACSFSVNGKTVEGQSQEECERLKKDFEKAAGSVSVPSPLPPQAPATSGQSQVACAFNINGKLYEGKSQAECDQLKKDLGITTNVPTLPAPVPAPVPAPAPAPAPSQGSDAKVACAFNINGQLYEGKSQAECDKLKKDLGLQF